ncbi:AAA family ATPase [Chloroflexi bacterium TSY]|nr:AAA family ATPase [Chloroflexi bacterium TSY]
MSRLRLYLFGSPQIELDDLPLSLSRRKALALLVYLAIEQQPQSRDSLAAFLWPEYSQRDARTDLSRTLSYLNRTLGEEWLIADRQHIGINPESDLWIDVVDFRQLATQAGITVESTPEEQLALLTTAVNGYQGDFMAGFSLPDSPAFDDWHTLQTQTLQQQLGQVLERLSQLHAAQGEYDSAIAAAQRWLNLDPTREQAHRQLMLLYTWSDQHAAALRQYRECERILNEELGVTPDGDTKQLFEAIKERRLPASALTLEPPQSASFIAQSHPGQEMLVTLPEPSHTVFVGRMHELDRLDGYLKAALAGRGQVVFVTGEAGAGKSALVSEFAQRAQVVQPDLVVAYGNCNAQIGISDPYLPFRELLYAMASNVMLAPILAQIIVQRAPALVDTLLPTGDLIGGLNWGGTDEPGWLSQLEQIATHQRTSVGNLGLEQSRIFEQVTAVLLTLAVQQPLVLVLDDLHWVDASSAALLFHLGRRINDSPILIIGTYRPEDIDAKPADHHPLVSITSELKRIFGDVWIYLNRLGQEERREFIDALLDSEPNHLGETFRQAFFRHTGGHALFTTELLRDMQERGDLLKDEADYWIEGSTLDWGSLPTKVEATIGKRIDRLDGDLREILLVASVQGDEFSAEVIAQVQGIEAREVVRKLNRALGKQHRLIVEQGRQKVGSRWLSSYVFRHILFQHYLVNTLGDAEQSYLHEEVGNALETLHDHETQ